jgi:hypothetical protein
MESPWTPQVSPLMSEKAAAEWLGMDLPAVRRLAKDGQLNWYKKTRTFARAQVLELAQKLEREILHESQMGSVQQAMGSQRGTRQRASLD